MIQKDVMDLFIENGVGSGNADTKGFVKNLAFILGAQVKGGNAPIGSGPIGWSGGGAEKPNVV